MQTSKSRVLLAVFIVLVAIVLATSTTYAWLSMDTSPEVWQFDVQVTSGDNITIAVTSVDGDKPGPSAFKSYVSQTEIDDFAGFFDLEGNVRAGEDLTLTTVTTQDANTFTMDFPKSTFNPDQAAYYAFDLHFQGDMPYNIRLNPNRTEVDSHGTAIMPTYFWPNNGYDGGVVDTIIPAFAKDAVRIAFGKYIFEPNADADGSWGNFGGNKNLAIDAYNYYKGTNIVAPLGPNVFNASELNGYTHTLLTLEQNGDICEGKFTVKIWLEGWDADALDSIKSQVLSIMLGFEGDLDDDILALESISGKTYDGAAYNPSNIALLASDSGGAISYLYKKQGSTEPFSTTAPKDAGLYTVRIVREAYNDSSDNKYYNESIIYANFEIDKVELKVTYTGETITYGEEPGLALSYIGFITGEDESTLIKPEVVGAPKSAGTYTLAPSGGEANNYDFTYISGELKINVKSVTVTANSHTITYGDALPALTYTAVGLVSDDTLTGQLEINWNGATAPDADTYDILIGTLGNPNYHIEYTEGELEIEKAEYDISAVEWNADLFFYSGETKKVELLNLPSGLSVTYEDNEKEELGSYIATAKFTSANDNYKVPEDWTHNWKIIA